MAVFTLTIDGTAVHEGELLSTTLRLAVNTSLDSRLIRATLSAEDVERLTRHYDIERVWRAAVRFAAFDVERFVRAGGLRPTAGDVEPLTLRVPAGGVLLRLENGDVAAAIEPGSVVSVFEA